MVARSDIERTIYPSPVNRRKPNVLPSHLRILSSAFLLAMIGAFLFTAPTTAAAQTAGKTMTTASGLQIIDSKVGTGATPKSGQICVMHYTGWLYENGQEVRQLCRPQRAARISDRTT